MTTTSAASAPVRSPFFDLFLPPRTLRARRSGNAEVLNPEPVSPPWRVVTLIRRNGSGQWITNSDGTPKRKTYIEDTRTHDLYLYEPAWVTASKCFEITIANPFYTSAMVVLNIFYTCRNVVSVAAKALVEFVNNCAALKPLEATTELLKGFLWDIPLTAAKDVYTLIWVVICGALIELSAIYGLILDPRQARNWIAENEKQWHYPLTYKNDYRYPMLEESQNADCPFSCTINEIYMLAFCFAVRGNLNDVVSATNPTLKFEEAQRV